MDVKLGLIIPVFNAESFILDTLRRLTDWRHKLDYHVQIVIVNDGSTDSTKQIIQSYLENEDDMLELQSYDKNKGKGFAVRRGMLATKGKYKIFMDADIPYGFDIIDRILYYLDFKEFDVCIGNRKSRRSNYYIEMSQLRKLSSKVFTMFISRYVVTGVNDTQCGLKGFRAEVADKLFAKQRIDGFAFDVELLYLSYKYEYDIKRIPVIFEGNDVSTINLWKNSLQMLRDIALLPFRYHFTNKYR